MTQLVDSQALQAVSRTLQLSTPGAQETLFVDERLEQTIDVTPMVRRGLTLAGSEGVYSANIRNTHLGSEGNIVTVVNPWALGLTANPPFPGTIPLNQDLWIIGFDGITVSGDGAFDSAFFDIFVPGVSQAFGTATSNIVLAGFGNELELAGEFFLGVHSNSAQHMFSQRGIRVPRNSTFRWHTRNVGSTSPVYQINLLLGLFPAGLGQDGMA